MTGFLKNKKMRKIITVLALILSIQFVNGQSFNGFALYNAQGSNTTYLIDENQEIAHEWVMNTECNYTVALKENGNLVFQFCFESDTMFQRQNPALIETNHIPVVIGVNHSKT